MLLLSHSILIIIIFFFSSLFVLSGCFSKWYSRYRSWRPIDFVYGRIGCWQNWKYQESDSVFSVRGCIETERIGRGKWFMAQLTLGHSSIHFPLLLLILFILYTKKLLYHFELVMAFPLLMWNVVRTESGRSIVCCSQLTTMQHAAAHTVKEVKRNSEEEEYVRNMLGQHCMQ